MVTFHVVSNSKRPHGDGMKERAPGVSKGSVSSDSDMRGGESIPEEPRRRIWQKLRRWAKRGAIVVGALVVVTILGIVFTVRHFEAELPSIADLKGNYRPPQVTRVLARDGNTLLAELFTERLTEAEQLLR